MGYGMMNHNMDLFRAKYALNEMEMKIKLAGKKKKSAKKKERPSWKETIKKNYGEDPLEKVLEEDSKIQEITPVQEREELSGNKNSNKKEMAASEPDIREKLVEAGTNYEKLREAVLWSEILGDPVSRKRQERRRNRMVQCDRRKG